MPKNTKQPARGTQPDYYRILGVDGNASPEEIAEAYRALVLQCHPDLNPGDPQAEARFLAVQAAFEVLSNRVKRREYDRTRGPYRTYVPSKIDPLAWHVRYNPPPRRPRWRFDTCAEELVRWPAICLLVLGVIGVIYGASGFLDIIFHGPDIGFHGPDIGVVIMAIALLLVPLSITIGAVNMLTLRSYRSALVAAILVMFFCCPGIIVGIWALFRLSDGMVRSAFES